MNPIVNLPQIIQRPAKIIRYPLLRLLPQLHFDIWIGEGHIAYLVGEQLHEIRGEILCGRLIPHQMQGAGPGGGNHCQIVSAPTQSKQPALAILIGKLDYAPDHIGVALQGDIKAGQGVRIMGICAYLSHYHLWDEPRKKLWHHLIEGRDEFIISRVHRHGNIHRISGTLSGSGLLNESSSWKQVQSGFVHGEREYISIQVEDLLHPVAMMGIYIQVEDAGEPFSEGADGEGDIVEDAKSRSLSGKSMMKAACQVECYAVLIHDHSGCIDAPAGHEP